MAPPAAPNGAGDVTVAVVESGSSATVAKPPNTTDGDFLLAVASFANSGGTWTTVPAGWTSPSGGIYTANRTSGIWGKPVPSASAETATDYTFAATGGGSSRGGALIRRITGADLDSPWDAIGVWQAALGATGITTTRADCLLLGAFWSFITGTTPNAISAPAGMTSVGGWSVSPSSSTTHLLAAEDRPTAGATGSRTATSTPSGSSALSVLVAIAAPVTGEAHLTQDADLTATAADVVEGAADLTQTAVLTAAGTVPDPDLTGAADLTQTSALVVADPGQARTLSAGVWRPYLSHRLVGGVWTLEDA